jgi:hypothetical protein
MSGKETRPYLMLKVYIPSYILLAAAFFFNVCAVTRIDSSFTTFSDTNRVTINDSMAIAIKARDSVRLEFNAKPNLSGFNAKTPDVISPGNRNFRFFWSNQLLTTGNMSRIFRRDFQVADTGLAVSDTVNVSGSQSLTAPLGYLHVDLDAGNSGYAVTVLDDNNLIKAYGPNRSRFIDSIGGGNILYSAQCRLAADTFLIIYPKNGAKMISSRVYMNGSDSTLVNMNQTLTLDAVRRGYTYPSLSSDSSGNCLALWINSGTLCGFVFDSSLTLIDSFTLNSTGYQNRYDYAPSLSFAKGKFVSVDYESGKLVMRVFSVGASSVTINSIDIASGAIAYFPSIAYNGKSVEAVWIEAADSSNVYMRSVRFPVSAGNIDASSRDTTAYIKLSNTLVSPDTVIVNSTTDTAGNIGVAWHMNGVARCGIIVKRNIVYDSATWVSLPIRVQSALTDSIRLDTAAVISGSASSGSSCRVIVIMGTDSAGMNDTVYAGSKSVMNESTKGIYRFFQYKISLVSSSNQLTSPVVRKVLFRWDKKPRLTSLLNAIAGNVPYNARFGDTITCMSRLDNAKLTFGVIDPDSDQVYTAVTCAGNTVSDTFTGAEGITTMSVISPLAVSDSFYTCRFHASDASGWAAQDSVVYIKTRNSVPLLYAMAIRGGSRDTVNASSTSRIDVKESDSVDFVYMVVDTNDAAIKAYLKLNGAIIDSTDPNVWKHYMFKCSLGSPQGDQFVFSASDADTTVTKTIICGVDHFPHIDSIRIAGKKAMSGDSVVLTLGTASLLRIFASDADVGYWDTLDYSYRTCVKGLTSFKGDSVYFIPAHNDSAVTVMVHDLFDVTDSFRFYIKAPWYEKDSVINNGILSARKRLLDSVSLIVGGEIKDTVFIPVKNTGNDTLRLTALKFNPGKRHWLDILVPLSGGYSLMDSSGNISIKPCLPDSTITLCFVFFADSLAGDGILDDTVFVYTNDAMHSCDTFHVRMEYNDLPRIDSEKVAFVKGKAYWLSHASHSYVFPPHGKIEFTFSEPIDSASAVNSVTAYSVFDSAAAGTITYIPLSQSWSSDRKTISLSAAYSQTSPYFKIKPQSGMFIPTDSIRIVISSAITDTAKTPSGPNNLDIHHIRKRAAISDTFFSYRIDSITFDIVSVMPDSADNTANPGDSIKIVFSSAPLSGSIDTSRNGNRSLVVYSAYKKSSQLAFSSISQNDDTVVFVPARKFFYGDTVYCRYRSATGRDSLGYPVALSNNGIPVTLFDTSSSDGDKLWYFTVKDLPHKSVTPSVSATGVDGSVAVSIIFSDSLPQGVIDTSCTGNRTFTLTSKCSNGSPIDFFSVKTSGKQATFSPAFKLYYNDSVTCSYKGLSTKDSSVYSVDSLVFSPDKALWHFIVKNIAIVSAQPESASVTKNIHPEIIMKFSEPVYAGTFDYDTSAFNRSFKMTSTYGKDTLLHYKSISLSGDGKQIDIMPEASYFSKDSVHCYFTGFPGLITYGASDNLTESSTSLVCKHEWYFIVGDAGFYTYPNPYKPGVDPRHCSNGGPCGIWFKNLHTLKSGVNEVSIRIFTMSTHEIYCTRKAGITIRFETGNSDYRPEWKWDTRNQRGELVASGLYFYAIYDIKDNMIKKGKLMIVR